MSRHAFTDESVRRGTYIVCAVTVSSSDLGAARTALRSLRARGQRRIHFSTESDQRRRQLLKEMSTLKLTSTIYVAKHRDEIAARAAILATAAVDLHGSGVTRLVLEAREGQDKRDRATLYSALGPHPNPEFNYTHHKPAGEPLLWVPDAVAWAWGRGGRWRQRVNELQLVAAVRTIDVA